MRYKIRMTALRRQTVEMVFTASDLRQNFFQHICMHADIVFVFSDDIPWCKKYIHSDGFVYVDINHGSDSWKDMYLMSKCKINIVANSSFSWWGAYLNRNKSVIAPDYIGEHEKYFPDYYPPSWKRIGIH